MSIADERLHLLYEMNRGLTTATDFDELLRYATRRVRELFDAEGCALLLLDRHRHEFYFPVSSQSESRREVQAMLQEIRFPSERGIAGWVLAHNEAALVPDVGNDPRHYRGVDQTTHMTTRSLLCAPLRTPSGNVGVIEVVNPRPDALRTDDLEFLEAIAGDVAVACEKAQLYRQLRSEVVSLRQTFRAVGLGLLVLGGLIGGGVSFGHFARSLPVGELFVRPAMWTGLASLGGGLLLIGVARGWLVRRAPH
jgi:GAF domain-containing protein